jgi:DNA-binding transcriptional MerR regulator
MTTSYQIAEVSRRSGFPASTLRYYEDVGLMPPAGRTDAGYRIYDDNSLAKLAFIARAKQLGCSLDEIADLVTAWEGDRCEPVQVRLRELVGSKITETQGRLREMAAFAAQLQEAAAALGVHTPDGPCDDDCGCTSTASSASSGSTAVVLTDRRPSGGEPPIACTLGAEDMAGRLEAWQDALEPVIARTAIDQGMRLTFTPGMSPIADRRSGGRRVRLLHVLPLRGDRRHPWLGTRGDRAGRGPGSCPRALRGRVVTESAGRREGLGLFSLGAVACVACCAGPIVAFLGGLTIAGLAGTLVIGVAGLAVAAIAAVSWLTVRRRRQACSTSSDQPVAVAAPTTRASR